MLFTDYCKIIGLIKRFAFYSPILDILCSIKVYVWVLTYIHWGFKIYLNFKQYFRYSVVDPNSINVCPLPIVIGGIVHTMTTLFFFFF